VLGLLVAVCLAFVWSGPAAEGGFLHASLTTKLGVALIFLIHGMGLATKQMLGGWRPAKLHIFCLGWNFVLFPVFAGLLLWPFSTVLLPEIRMGVWMLSILPTTIASAAALTATSGGAVPQAIFSSLFSNLLAVFLVPVLALLYVAASSGMELPLLSVMGKLSLMVLLPLFAGQLVRLYFHEAAVIWSRRISWLKQLIIIYIVYVAFAGSAQTGLLGQLGLAEILETLLVTVLLLLFSSWLVWRSSGWLRLDHCRRIAAFFCASQKSLATGLPLLTSIFTVTSFSQGSAMVLIPLMLFHPMQLLLGAYLAGRFQDGA